MTEERMSNDGVKRAGRKVERVRITDLKPYAVAEPLFSGETARCSNQVIA
jgi:hypothetical protein